jgi:hypothetical protein
MKLSLLIGAEHRPADSMAQRFTEHLETSPPRASLGSMVSQLETTCLMARRRGPSPGGFDHADHRLPAGMHIDVLEGSLLSVRKKLAARYSRAGTSPN